MGTPIISSLRERPRCSESGCGRPDSNEGERQAAWWEHLGVPGGQVPRAGARCPRLAQGVAELVAWDATPQGGKEGADGRTTGAAFPVWEGSKRWRSQLLPVCLTTSAHQQHGFSGTNPSNLVQTQEKLSSDSACRSSLPWR